MMGDTGGINSLGKKKQKDPHGDGRRVLLLISYSDRSRMLIDISLSISEHKPRGTQIAVKRIQKVQGNDSSRKLAELKTRYNEVPLEYVRKRSLESRSARTNNEMDGIDIGVSNIPANGDMLLRLPTLQKLCQKDGVCTVIDTMWCRLPQVVVHCMLEIIPADPSIIPMGNRGGQVVP
ncbi:hypothetical protein Tco_0944077 [Tanacetum coccineum]